MNLWTKFVALLVLPVAIAAASQGRRELAVCVGNSHVVDKVLAKEWEGELRRILETDGLTLRLAGCNEEGAIQIHFLRAHPSEPNALGAARTRRERVLPRLEVYSDPVAALIGTRLPGLLGKALARVTAHELIHYVRQETAHAHSGAFSGHYTPGLLLAARPEFFSVR